MESVTDLVCLQNGQAAPLFVLELVFLFDRMGVPLRVIDGVVVPGSEHADRIDDDLIDDLRRFGPGVAAILLNMPNDSSLGRPSKRRAQLCHLDTSDS